MKKMELFELEKLDNSLDSIKKIDSFLSNQIQNSKEYLIAIKEKSLRLHFLNHTNEALKILYSYTPNLNSFELDGSIAILDAIILITEDVKRFDQALQYIRIKKTLLPVSKQNLYMKDVINYLLKKEDYENLKKELVKYINDDITKEEKIYSKEILADIVFKEGNYDDYLFYARDLNEYYKNKLDDNKLSNIIYNVTYIYFKKQNYLRVISNINNHIEDFNIKLYKLKMATLAILTLIELNDYKKASIYDSNYEELADLEYPKYSIEFINAAIKLYEKQNSLIAIKEYKSRLELLEKEFKPKEIKKEIIQDDKPIIIPKVKIKEESINKDIYNDKILNPKEEINYPKTLVKEKIVNYKDLEISEFYQSLYKIIDIINEVDINNKFREIYRRCMIECQKLFKFKESYIFINDNKTYGYHYKVERVYDKNLKIDDIIKTINYQSYITSSEKFLDLSDNENNISIVKFEKFDKDMFGFAVPLKNSVETIGSIAYFSDEPILTKNLAYEGLKIISSLINSRLIESINNFKFNLSNQKLFFLKDSMSLGIKEEMSDYIHLSIYASKMLDTLEDIELNEYYLHIDNDDLIKYREIKKELYKNFSKEYEIEYNYNTKDKKLHIKEKMYSILIDGEVYILSILEDLTKLYSEKEKLKELAYTNPITKINTELKLTMDLNKEFINKKLSLAIISINDFKLYEDLYGYNFNKQIIATLSKKLIEETENDFNIEIYHFYSDTFAILFNNMNDKRLIDLKLNTYFNNINKYFYSINKRVNLLFNAGVYRLSKSSSVKNINEIIDFAFDSMNEAKNILDKKHHIIHYDKNIYLEKFMEKNLITEISEAIDKNKLSLTYTQVVNFPKNSVLGFMLNLNLDSMLVDIDKINEVAKRRNLEKKLEMYLLEQALKEQKIIYQEQKRYPRLFIYLDYKYLDTQVLKYYYNIINFYKAKCEKIHIILDNANNKMAKYLKELGFQICSLDLLDIYRLNINYFIFDFKTLKDAAIDVKELCKKNNIEIILKNVDTKEDLDFSNNNGFSYFYGNYYNKIKRLKDLIGK